MQTGNKTAPINMNSHFHTCCTQLYWPVCLQISHQQRYGPNWPGVRILQCQLSHISVAQITAQQSLNHGYYLWWQPYRCLLAGWQSLDSSCQHWRRLEWLSWFSAVNFRTESISMLTNTRYINNVHTCISSERMESRRYLSNSWLSCCW